MSLVRNYYSDNLIHLRRRYTTVRHSIEDATEVFAEFLHSSNEEESFEAQYFKSRILEMRLQLKDIESKYRMNGGNISALD